MRQFYLLRYSLLLAIGALSFTPAFAGTITVTSSQDDGMGSFRKAVSMSSPGDTVRFASSLNGTPIDFMSVVNVEKDLVILGNGMRSTLLNGNMIERPIAVRKFASVVIKDLGIYNGMEQIGGGLRVRAGSTVMVERVRINDCVATGIAATQGGGAIYNEGTLTLKGVVLENNKATGKSGSGGAILNAPGATLTIADSRIERNEANRAGGGIEETSGSGTMVTITNTRINRNIVNTAPGNGGGIHVGGDGNTMITGGTVDLNEAGQEGGGLWNGSGTMTVDGTLVRFNIAKGDDADDGGGGLFNNGGGTIVLQNNVRVLENKATGTAGSGGGILNNTGTTLIISDSRIESNVANRAGGGIEDASGSGTEVLITNTRINRNIVNTAPGNGGGIHVGSDGNTTIVGGTVDLNEAGQEGGGLWNGAGTMTVDGTLVRFNIAKGDDADDGGGGLFNNGGGTIVLQNNARVLENKATGMAGSGGGILNNVGSSLSITDSRIERNVANRAGGGIEDASGSGTKVLINNTRIDRNIVNTAPGNGGGIHVGSDGNTTIIGGTVDFNEAGQEGGGLWNGAGTMTVEGTLVRFNVGKGDDANDGGGGLHNNGGGTIDLSNVQVRGNKATGASGSGGGILNLNGATLLVNNSMILSNEANRAGGGIEDASGAESNFVITDSKLSGNIVNNAPGNGGGVHITGDGSLFVDGSEFMNNVAGSEGGALWNGLGTMEITGTLIAGNVAKGDGASNGGGGVFNNGGTLMISESDLDRNLATGAAGSGGGLLSTDGDVTVTDSRFFANKANRAGGGVEVIDGTYSSFTVDYLRNDAGSAPGNGGALHITGMSTMATLYSGSVKENTAANEGGGLWNQKGSMMKVNGVSIRFNQVTDAGTVKTRVAGAGVFNNGGKMLIESSVVGNNRMTSKEFTGGGGIANNTGGTIDLVTTTVSTNDGGLAGGGIVNDGTMTVTNSTIAENVAKGGGGYAHATNSASLTIKGTVIGQNRALIAPDFGAVFGKVMSQGWNFIGMDPLDQFPAVASDIENRNPHLKPLNRYGGPTATMEPSCNSTLIDMGDPDDFSTDQAGRNVFGERRDIGAFERQSPCGNMPPAFVSAANAANSVTDVEDALGVYPNPVSDAFLNVRLPAGFAGETTVHVTGMDGRLMSSRKVAAGGYRLDVADYSAGAYTLQAINGERVESIRFVVAK